MHADDMKRVYKVVYKNGSAADVVCDLLEYSCGVFEFSTVNGFPLIVNAESVQSIYEIKK